MNVHTSATPSTLLLGACASAIGAITTPAFAQEAAPAELPTTIIPHPGSAAEAYFSPDGQSVICNAQLDGDATYFVYTMKLDGTDVRRINDRGMDACSFYFPDGGRIIWTSTRDCLHLPPGDYSEPSDYPSGAELFISDLSGGDITRLTHNEQYDAEVSVSPDGEWILFSRQTDGDIDLWRMRPDGGALTQLTHTPDWREGGAFYMPDGATIIYRAWRAEDESQSPKPMTIFTIGHEGGTPEQITTDPGTNWAPFPAPDGRHFVYVRMLPPHNFEIFLMNIETKEKTRLTYSDAFDGYPVISPDGKTMLFSSSRDVPPGQRKLRLVTIDVSSLNLGPR